MRKLSELPYQQTQGEIWDELETTLTDLLFIEAKCAEGMTYDLVADYNAALDSLPEAQEGKKKEREHEERVNRYTEELIAYARVWNEISDRPKKPINSFINSFKHLFSLPKADETDIKKTISFPLVISSVKPSE